jgi:Tfp pilus assembly protein PilN
MLRTNLSTRPFYNERLVLVALLASAVLIGVFTLFNVTELVSLSSRYTTLAAEVEQAQHRATEVRQQAGRVRASIDPVRLEAVSQAAHEANQLIDRRTFSWTGLFNQFEATLPAGVRITAVKPLVDPDGRFIVSMTVVGRRVEDINAFIEALEKTSEFSAVLSREERTNEEGLLEATLQGTYLPGATEPTVRRAR